MYASKVQSAASSLCDYTSFVEHVPNVDSVAKCVGQFGMCGLVRNLTRSTLRSDRGLDLCLAIHEINSIRAE